MQDTASSPVIDIAGERHHVITGVERMPPFLMTLTSASDVWAYLTSNGGITAGRRNVDHAIFPYRTEDLVADDADVTGGVTRLRVTDSTGRTSEWRPFGPVHPDLPRVERSVAKTDLGDVVHFEERRPDLDATIRVSWRVSPRFGLVRSVTLTCADPRGLDVRIIDGIRNVLPPGVTARTQREMSPLLDAYKISELDPATGLAWVRLNSMLTDRAEASEALAATAMWQVGAEPERHHLSTDVLHGWGTGEAGTQARGQRAAYLIELSHHLTPATPARWSIVVDIDQDAAALVDLEELLSDPAHLEIALEDDIAAGRSSLKALVGSSDGWSRSGDAMADAHLAASTMFNLMRGGVPLDGYTVEREDVRRFLRERNAPVAERSAAFLDVLPERLSLDELRTAAGETGDLDLSRLVLEYLPLTFGRRHGDPSRPWNSFEIDLRDEHGRPRLAYQGNWRDIFQNWEALAWSFPELTESMVRAFLNATTIDGYNPYRVFRQGVEWEVPEPDDPWSNIGYWSDHQIIYLLKLLEVLHDQDPQRLAGLLGRVEMVHVDVPYRLATYDELLVDAQNSVFFDEERHAATMQRVAEIGGDGRLLVEVDGTPVRAGLVEKLLILLTAKMANFVPEGGIWMTTQRPEWNDANNALVGRGLSIVTVAQLHRFVAFLERVLEEAAEGDASVDELEISEPLAVAVRAVTDALSVSPPADGRVDDHVRRSLLDRLGRAGSDYRYAVAQQPSARTTVRVAEVREHLAAVRSWLSHTVRTAHRSDGLYDAYNLLRLGEGTASVIGLDQMLEGQVAVLGSGILGPDEVDALVAALPGSRLYREDANTYQLYPEPDIRGFLERNTLPDNRFRANELLVALVAAGDRRVVVGDRRGGVHVAAGIRHAEDLRARLADVGADAKFGELVEQCEEDVLAIFEEMFDHASFTGRSSSFFAYEGVGSVYWHMVSKLVLAIREQFDEARRSEAVDEARVARLSAAYEQARGGLGMAKTAEEYGAFPHDPYSHTPAGRGARQPGMTGQVKEDVLIRRAELGVAFVDGRLRLDAGAVSERDWSTATGWLSYVDVDGREQHEPIPVGALGFTVCQVPVIMRRVPGGESLIEVVDADGAVEASRDGLLSRELSASVFARDGRVRRIVVTVPA
ncbi:hypothetical protein GA707_06490 [Nostocoides sp. F2B08]|uniref:hypothetical protein n=1 Tax=Nostocoides sp. F2B08 TaxID=2653936 RepID=UPI001262C331|nr:hypothetical protein [Tetrasphaera sp. F2B08]KAB7745557.1 hypothetical protein GA707_06490 [Tetrasphaera sp. F2B08]